MGRLPLSNAERSKRWRKKNPKKASAADRRNNRAKRRRMDTYVANLRDAACKDCKGIYPTVCMEFDHTRGTKLFKISGYRRAWWRLKAEIAKCDVVCANCHCIRTARRRNHA